MAPVAKEKSDPNRLLRGPVIGNVPMIPPPNLHLDSHWKVGQSGFSQSGPAPAAPVPDGMDPAPVDHGTRCDGVPGYWGPRIKATMARLTTLPTSRIGGHHDHRITAPTKPGAAHQMTERPEWTHVSVGTLPTIIDFIRTTVHRHLQSRRLPGSVLRRLCAWYVEWDPLAFAKVKALRRRGADSV